MSLASATVVGHLSTVLSKTGGKSLQEIREDFFFFKTWYKTIPLIQSSHLPCIQTELTPPPRTQLA